MVTMMDAVWHLSINYRFSLLFKELVIYVKRQFMNDGPKKGCSVHLHTPKKGPCIIISTRQRQQWSSARGAVHSFASSICPSPPPRVFVFSPLAGSFHCDAHTGLCVYYALLFEASPATDF